MNKNSLFLIISVFFITSNVCAMLISFSDKEGKIDAHNYLDSFFERTFTENKKELQKLPKKARLKVLESCGEAKPLIFIAMTTDDVRYEVFSKTMLMDANGCTKDALCLQHLCAMPVGKILEICNQKTRQAACFPIVLNNQHIFSPASHMRIKPDCAKVMSDATRGKTITSDGLLVINKTLADDIYNLPGLKDQCISVDLSRSEKINLLARSLARGTQGFCSICLPSPQALLRCCLIAVAMTFIDLYILGIPSSSQFVVPYTGLFLVGVGIPVAGVSILTNRSYLQDHPPVKTITFEKIKSLSHA